MELPEVLTVSTPYGDIAVHLRGQSPASAPGLLLLHANPGDHRDFDEIVPALTSGWAIAAVDWPGYGALTLLGNSAGGYAAVRLAQRVSDLVRGVMLVQSAGFAPRNILTRALFRAVASPVVAARFIGPHARLYLGPPDRGGVRAIYERARAVADQAASLDVYRSLWRSFDSPPFDLAAEGRLLPGVPVRVVWGRLDATNPWFVNRRGVARALPQAEVTVLSTGHEPFECVHEIRRAGTASLAGGGALPALHRRPDQAVGERDRRGREDGVGQFLSALAEPRGVIRRAFHDPLDELVRAAIADHVPSEARLAAGITAYLDGCLADPATKALLVQAHRRRPRHRGGDAQRRCRPALLTADLVAMGWRRPEPIAVLLVAAIAETALLELDAPGSRADLRDALPRLVRRDGTPGND